MTISLKQSADVSSRALLRKARRRALSRSFSSQVDSGHAPVQSLDRTALVAALRDALPGADILDDAGSLGVLAQDASSYFQVPLAVVQPRSREEVVTALAVCRRFGAPVTCRTGKGGAYGLPQSRFASGSG